MFKLSISKHFFVAIVLMIMATAAPSAEPTDGLQVTILIFSGRPNPTFVLTDKAVLTQLKTLFKTIPVNDKFRAATITPSILGYNGILVEAQGKMSKLPNRFLVYKENIEIEGIQQKTFLIDSNHVVEDLLLNYALEQKILDQKMSDLIKSKR